MSWKIAISWKGAANSQAEARQEIQRHKRQLLHVNMKKTTTKTTRTPSGEWRWRVAVPAIFAKDSGTIERKRNHVERLLQKVGLYKDARITTIEVP